MKSEKTMQDRVILHSDFNCFYASVETALHPEYRGQPIAVCGSTEERHGIVLAKSEPAKRAGVKTGMTNAEALSLCPGLLIVPPHFEVYAKFSRMARKIYARYTDLIEPFGMDECWLDVTGSTRLFGSGEEIAENIRRTIREELGLTVSVGVSFNKVFAKLASDLKKPDAVSVVSRENFRDMLYPLPVSALLYVGRATLGRLNVWGIRTIGDLAATDPALLRELLGVNGLSLWNAANGLDSSPVAHMDDRTPAKSLSHGVTCSADLTDADAVRHVILELSQSLTGRLRDEKMSALGVELYVKNSDLGGERFSTRLPEPTQSPSAITRAADEIFRKNYRWRKNVRAVTVALTPLCPEDQPFQPDLFRDEAAIAKRDKMDGTVDVIRRKFGSRSILPAELLRPSPVPEDSDRETVLPGGGHR